MAQKFTVFFSTITDVDPINTIVWLTVYRQDSDRDLAIINPARESAKTVFSKVETALANSPFLAGNDFTAADVMMGFTLGSAKWLNILTEDYPRTMAYVDRLFARPGLQQALT